MGTPVSKRRLELSRIAQWRARLSARMARSSRIFLLGVVVACGVEVLVDWNSTLRDINVLRSAIQQKGENYVGILGKASDDELGARDKRGLERLSQGIFDDQDAVYVRFTDTAGAVVWDRLKPDFADGFRQRTGEPFAQRYTPLMDRDTQRALHDPEGLKSHVANSRYKDFAQAWTDATARILSAVVPPKEPAASPRGVVVYQDRLHDEKHQRDDRVSYAIGTVLGDSGGDIGTVIVAFDMSRVNDAVRFKYMKFGGVCTLFVVLILVQNVVSRRTRLRLLDLDAKYAAAKGALRTAMPRKEIRGGDLSASGAVDQARGPVDGMLWTAADEGGSLLVLMVDPDGDGVDAASIALHAVQTFAARRADAPRAPLEDELRAVGDAAMGIPLTRPIGALILRVDATTGAYTALCGSGVQLGTIGKDAAAPETEAWETDLPRGVAGPVFRAAGTLGPGASIVATCANPSRVDPRGFCDAVARYMARAHGPAAGGAGAGAAAMAQAQDAAIWARGKNPALAESDIAVVTVSRAGP